MSNFNSLIRVVAAAAGVLASAAWAQPANDLCSGAEVINVTAPATVFTSTTTTNIASASATVEAPGFSCFTSSVKNSIWFTFNAPANGNYRIDTCGVSNYDTIIQLYSGSSCGSLTQVASGCNDQGGCSPTNASALNLALTAGTYYVQVASWSSGTVNATSSTALNVSYTLPVVNDTCAGATTFTASATATATAPQTTAINTTASATEVTVSCIGSKNDIWYSFVAPSSGPYRIDTCGVSNYDTTLAVYTGACGSLTQVPGACNDQGGCTPTNASATVANLTMGTTYYVQVAAWSSATLDAASATAVNVTPLTANPEDQCSVSSPQLTLNVPVTARTAGQATVATAFDDARIGGAAACFAGLGQTSSTAPGRDVAFQFRAPEAGRYSFRLSTPSPSADAVMYLTDTCEPVTTGPVTYSPPQCVAASNRNTSGNEQVSCVTLTANQTVYVWVDEHTASTAGTAAELAVTPCVTEVEPNDSVATASPLACVTTGGIGTTTDVDFFALGAPPAGTRVFAMAEGAAGNVNNFDMRVTTATTTIEYDDLNLVAAFGASAPVIGGAILNGEPSYLRVNYNTATVAEPYVLYSALKTGAPAAEVEPNDTMATATTAPSNYFTGSITDGGTDVDVFAFTANAGDVIFASLDAVPDKQDAGPGTYNFLISLVDSSDTVLLTVDDTTNTTTFTPTGGSLTATTPTFPAEGLVYRVASTGTYGIRVGKTSGTNPNPYILSVSVGCADTLPTITSITPNAGTPAGNQPITLAGTNFNERSVVRFGSQIATVVSVSPAELVALSPASSSGAVAVSVTNGPGLVATVDPGFTFDDPPGLPPVLTAIAPTFGPVTGGTVVTLTGSVFRADAGVFFEVGGTTVPAAAVTVNNATRITATTPPHAQGVANVKVVNYDELESTLTGGFTFEGPPTVTSITPNAGLTTGGLTITLVGTNFRTGATVRVGGTLATSVVIASDGQSLTAVTPSRTTAGVVDVIVRNTDGQEVTVTGGFTYAFPAPTITGVTPAQGYAAGGTIITIAGSNFLTGPTVTVGGAPATNVVRVSASQVTAVTPPGTPGVVDVVLTNSDSQSVTRIGGFRYVAAPTLASLSPTSGPMQGGTRLTITGTDFVQGATVRLGGVPAFAVSVTSPTTATAVTNSSAPGAVDVVFVNPDGQSDTLEAGFTYEGAPSLTSLSPISGSTAGGAVVTLTGAGFLPTTTVTFGTVASPTVTRISNTELTAVTPAAPVGVVTVTVRNPDNQSASLQGAFRFVAPPTITDATPSTGDVAGGTVVTITGSGFNSSTTVSFGGTPATQVTLVSATELAAVSPKHAPGTVDLVVSTDGAPATLMGGFTYTRGAPTLTEVAPASGPVAGGTLLTLSGSGFAEGATVTVGGEAATDVVVVSEVLARAVVPPHAAGQVDVVFTNDDNQSSTLAGGFTYVEPPNNNSGAVTDGGTGAIGEDSTPIDPGGGVSCGCSSFDGSMFSMAGFGLLLVLSRRRRRS